MLNGLIVFLNGLLFKTIVSLFILAAKFLEYVLHVCLLFVDVCNFVKF